MKRNIKGFTITELVIVIVVIAILAAVLIPTFVSLINKANMSADEQAVRQMNTILAAEEVSDKPATVTEAKDILIANGIADFKPTFESNTYYWVGADNRVLLWTADEEDATKGKVTYPKESVKKYKDLTEPSADWSDLSTDYEVVVLAVEEGKPLKETLLDAIEAAQGDTIIKLPKKSTTELQYGGLYAIGDALKDASGVGKHVTIDLNGSTLSSKGTNGAYSKDESGNWALDENGDYIMNILEVPDNAELVLTNGKFEIDHATAAQEESGSYAAMASVMLGDGARFIMNDVDMVTDMAGVMASGSASEVSISGCKINSANYAVGTNRVESNNVHIILEDSEFSSTWATTMLINCPSDTYINNCKITGIVHAIALRAGHLEINNSTLITTDTQPGIYSYKNFAESVNYKGWWHSGNTIPAGTLVVGDYAKVNGNGTFSYAGDALVEMYNTKIQSADANAIPEILLASSDPAKKVSVTYDEKSTAGTIKLYGEDWENLGNNNGVVISNKGSIKVNGAEKN